METKRISPEEVVNAFKVTGLRARQGDYFPSNGCACGLGVLYALKLDLKVDTMGSEENAEKLDIVNCEVDKTLEINPDYRGGFACGFDGYSKERTFKYYSEADDIKTMGYEDGQRAWKACVESELAEDEK